MSPVWTRSNNLWRILLDAVFYQIHSKLRVVLLCLIIFCRAGPRLHEKKCVTQTIPSETVEMSITKHGASAISVGTNDSVLFVVGGYGGDDE